MNILCTGATGLVGHNFTRAAAEAGHRVLALCGKQKLPAMKNVEALSCDLLDEYVLQRAVLDLFPDAIVNCAAVASPINVDADPTLAEKMNVALPERLAQLSHHVGARLIHLSTDMVFDGSAAPYKNTDIPMPYNLYGTTKLMAEKAVLKISAPTTVVLRISHVLGNSLNGRRSFHEKLLWQWSEGVRVKQTDSEIKRPLSVLRLADLLVEICERSNLSGIYHYAGLESLSRYEMAVRVAKHFNLNPDEFIERGTSERIADLSLDMSCLAQRVKTRSCMFDEILPELSVPDDIVPWLKNKTGVAPVKRFKL